MSYMQDFLLEEEDVNELITCRIFLLEEEECTEGAWYVSAPARVFWKKFFMNKKDQICPFSCALVPFIYLLRQL